MIIRHVDGLVRCAWCGEKDLDYIAYHDNEWGVPEWDDQKLFEKLILDGFQAGLSWITILRKRENFRSAFDNFNPALIAQYDERKVEDLMMDKGIVRNRAKIQATVSGAKIWLEIMDGGKGKFANYLWSFVNGKPIVNSDQGIENSPTQSPTSRAMSENLRRLGFKFCGPTICYAFMQAVGMVNDHAIDCHRHNQV